jgi:hypothetical protein
MRLGHWVGGAVLATSLIAGAASAVAGVDRYVVGGTLAAVAPGTPEHGAFRMATADRSSGAHVERIEVKVRSLPMTGASAGSPPTFHLFLRKQDGTGDADFGVLRVNRHGNGGLIFDTRHTSLPAGVVTIADYGDGTIEVRDSTNAAVLTGAIPPFATARTFGHATQRLLGVDPSVQGHGEITVRRQNVLSGVQEEMSVACTRMTRGAAYTVVAIALDSTETPLGRFTALGRGGVGGFRLSTGNGDTIPGGSVLNLAGETVEVRDATHAAVLTGTFPTIP